MRVVFRTDASRKIGSGHVMRCITLAKALQKKGADIHFISREHDGHLCAFIEQEGIHVFRLPKISQEYLGDDLGGYASWLGCSWEQDAQESSNALQALSERADWLIVDHYALNEKWEKYCRRFVEKIMVIDDLANYPHDCSLLLNQNIFDRNSRAYQGKVPYYCDLVLGPNYALLQEEYAELHERASLREGAIKRIFVFFGGVDSANLTGRTLSALLNIDISTIEIDVVLGSSNMRSVMRDDAIMRKGNIHFHSNLRSLSGLIMKADLAIGASGTTSWERLCLGLPAIVISVADNQREIARSLDDRCLARWLGDTAEVTEAMIGLAASNLIASGLRKDWSLRCLEVVDGLGSARIVARMYEE